VGEGRLSAARPSAAQHAWLRRGLDQPGGKLPLFDLDGRRVGPRTVDRCIVEGWAEPWFANPLKPDWRVCKLTDAGRAVLAAAKLSAGRVGSDPDQLLAEIFARE
jgi:hypothetical protein